MKKLYTLLLLLYGIYTQSLAQSFKSFIDTDEAQCIAVANDTVWVGFLGGVNKMDLNGNIIKTYTASDFTGTHINCIAGDNAGGVWFGCEEGASRYQNGAFRLFTWRDGMSGDKVYGITTDKNGNVWFAHFGYGISKFDGSSWTKYTTGFASLQFYKIACDKEGNVWASLLDQNIIYKYDGISWQQYGYPSIANSEIASIFSASDSSIWVGHLGGKEISRFKNGTWTRYNPLLKDIVSPVNDFAEYQGAIYFRADTVIYSYKNDIFGTPYLLNDEPPSATGMAIDKNGSFWITRYRHIEQLTGSNTKYITNPNAPINKTSSFCGTSSLTVDQNGNIWTASHTGYSCYNGKTWKRYPVNDFEQVEYVCMDPKGRRWVLTGNYPTEVTLFDKDTVSLIMNTQYYPIHPKKVIFDKKGFTWIISKYKVYRLNADTLEKEFIIQFPNYYSSPQLNDIAQDTAGVIWISSDRGAISIKNDTITLHNSFPNLYLPTLGNIYVDNTNNYIYFAGHNLYYTGTEWKRLTGPNGYDITGSTCIIKDYDGSFWFGNYGAGLTINKNSNWKSLYTIDGLVSNYITNMIIDNRNNIWITTCYGISVVERDMTPTRWPKNKSQHFENISIYPNPSVENIYFTRSFKGMVSIYNLQGKCIMQKSSENIKNGLNISELKLGIYLVVIKDNENTYTSRFIKK